MHNQYLWFSILTSFKFFSLTESQNIQYWQWGFQIIKWRSLHKLRILVVTFLCLTVYQLYAGAECVKWYQWLLKCLYWSPRYTVLGCSFVNMFSELDFKLRFCNGPFLVFSIFCPTLWLSVSKPTVRPTQCRQSPSVSLGKWALKGPQIPMTVTWQFS